MRRWTSRLAAFVVASGAAAVREVRAEPTGAPPAGDVAPAPRANLSLGARFGASTAPFYTANFSSVRGHGLVAALSGSYLISTTDELGLAVPGALVSVEQPAGAYVDEVTWGNPTLFVTHRRASDVGGGRTLRWFGRVGVSLPLAEHGAPGALLSNRALALASAFEGWRDQESYFPGRLSVAPGGGLDLSSPPWRFEAGLKLPLLFEVSRANLPADSDVRPVGFAPVAHAGFNVRAARWLTPGLSADLVMNAVPPVQGTRDKIQTAQLVLRPALGFPLGRGVLLSADFVAPVGGSLGGSTFSGSLLVTTSW
jgi:hypothetical protein